MGRSCRRVRGLISDRSNDVRAWHAITYVSDCTARSQLADVMWRLHIACWRVDAANDIAVGSVICDDAVGNDSSFCFGAGKSVADSSYTSIISGTFRTRVLHTWLRACFRTGA